MPPTKLARPLRVLVCSGNLGNARPDQASIAEWLPKDGSYSEVTDSSDYPLPGPKEHAAILKDLGLSHFQVHDMAHAVSGAGMDDASEEALNGDDFFDIIVIGMQEATFDVPHDDPMIRVPILHPILKKTVFKAVGAGVGVLDSLSRNKDHTKQDHLKIFGNAVNPLEWLAREDSKVLQELFRQRLPSYDFSVRYQRGEMRLEILVRQNLDVEVLSVKAQNTGLGVNGVLNAANKGGIVAELLVEKSTRLSFCTAHLQAHEGTEHYHNRIRMAEVIFDGTAVEMKGGIWFDMAIKSHVCFMLGDLNFRTERKGDYTKEQQDAFVKRMVDDQNWRDLNTCDELFGALSKKECFVGFETLPCYFPPTFKVEREAGFKYKEQRRPSYTDRILWRTLNKLETCVKPVAYEPIGKFRTSDHKPIRGAFEVTLNPPVKVVRPGLGPRLLSAHQIMKSAMNLFGGGVGGGDDAANNQKVLPDTLHLLVSNIKSSIKKRTNLTAQLGPPDPYVMFVSLPEKLVRVGESKLQRFKGAFRLGANLNLATKKKAGKTTRTASGFPRTKKLTGTSNPDWGKEDLHLVVYTRDKEGNPVDARGAILMLCLMDHKTSVVDNHIGSFPLNLAHMLSVRPDPEAEAGGTILLGSGHNQKRNVHIMNLKQPLMKNTKQTGWISCKIESWWASEDDEKIAKSLSSSHLDDDDLKQLSRRDGSRDESLSGTARSAPNARGRDLWINKEEDM